MDKSQNTSAVNPSFIQINGTAVRLVFASEGNSEVISVVKDILKGAYLRSQGI